MTRSLLRSPWFPYRQSGSAATVRLFCLPPAGGSASSYRAWRSGFPSDIEVIPVQLPGRESRLSEDPVTVAAELVELVADVVVATEGPPFALFGHSMGAMLAYELAAELTDRGTPPVHLVVSGGVPAHLDHLRPAPLDVAGMSDAHLCRYFAEYGGTDEDILADTELMALLLPLLRADLTLCESHRWTPRAPLGMPITALGGAADPGVPAELLARWSELTDASFRMRTFPGGHHYLFDDVAAVIAAVSTTLLDSGGGAP
ncbi:thioesterase II family protein [Labedaea rhizosphaerae]|uniref:Surfactin synthase thioesterase subunit n=1 Tax=Labedaea rhizosphaerae TaxID=598644 RepID=A0A4R6S2T2_LABRH|nr:alpha/beta fold hydrolase [Labedaea rhizosphaerae]TDP92965.1 surfactin synthase thioesterase subunit [Labedaea rhizosphaerae]